MTYQLPTNLVDSLYDMPFPLYPFQRGVVDDLAVRSRCGLYMDVGTGKTAVSTYIALHKAAEEEVEQILVVMPPILLPAWGAWFDEIPGVTHSIYWGTPAQRAKVDMNADVILMSMQIFKNDFLKLFKFFQERRVHLIVDEATSIRNVSTQNHRRIRDFSRGRPLSLLTGTAISNPGQCYGYISLVTPGVYRNKNQFNMYHIDKIDFWGQPTVWKNLDELASNMLLNSVRIYADDVLDLPEIVYDVTPYNLAPAHLALYKRLAEEQLLLLPDGGKIDATTAQRLFQSLQQIVMNPSEFAGKPMRAAGYDLIDSVMNELNGEKIVIFNNYQITNAAVNEYLKKYNSVACYGLISPKQQQVNLKQFLTDPNCLVMTASPQSVGIGLNLQGVCRCVMFPELPLTSERLIQAVGRVHRDGQKKKVLVKMGVANGTIQVPLYKALLKKDDLIQRVTPAKSSLRNLIFGG